MYIPQYFKEEKLDVLHQLIRDNPLGLLISNGENWPEATALPFYLCEGESQFGTLQAHLARANPHWQKLDGLNVLVVFQGPDAYVSPNNYPSKNEHGMVVPTWNYVLVQARGKVKVIDNVSWIKRQITALTNQQETASIEPWKVSDAPDSYIDAQLKAIVGLEIEIKHLEGKWKVSQNRPIQDRKSVAENFEKSGHLNMSELVRKYGDVEKTD